MSALPPLRKGQAAPQALVERRAMIAASRKDQKPAPGVEVLERSRGGVAGVECNVAGAKRTIIHFHGGGYRLGDAKTWAPWGSQLAKLTQSNVVLPDYRLAPEDPFPAAIHDAVAVYGELVQAQSPVVVSGDSAGGGLAAALAVACKQLGLPQPAALVLISAWLDLTVEAETFTTRAKTDQLFSRDAALEGSGQYLQGASPKDPLASPLFADLAGFPPVQVFAGGAEVLLGDSLEFAKRAGEAGATVEAHFVAGMQHVWPTIFPDLPESKRAMDAIARFVREHTGE
jgi:acetyl esterase/lipase